MHPELDNLLSAVVADGEISPKEREVFLRKAQTLGFDPDEAEIYLDGKLAETKKSSSVGSSVVALNCKGCGAALPTPTGSTVTCEYCGATAAISRPRSGGSAPSLATKDNPAGMTQPTSWDSRHIHKWAISKLYNENPLMDEGVLRSLAQKPLSQTDTQVWLFTVQYKGGFTAMCGVDEIQQVMEKDHNGELTPRSVKKTRWSPFSSQLRFSKIIAGGTGVDWSTDAAAALNESGDAVQSIIKTCDEWSFSSLPPQGADASFKEHAEHIIDLEQRKESIKIMQGDSYRDLKFNAEQAWQPILLNVPVGVISSSVGAFPVGQVSGEETKWHGTISIPDDPSLIREKEDLKSIILRNSVICSAIVIVAALVVALVSKYSGLGSYAALASLLLVVATMARAESPARKLYSAWTKRENFEEVTLEARRPILNEILASI